MFFLPVLFSNFFSFDFYLVNKGFFVTFHFPAG